MKQRIAIFKGTQVNGCNLISFINKILDKYPNITFETFTTHLLPKNKVVFTEYENMFFE